MAKRGAAGMEEGEELIFSIGDRVKTLKFGLGTVRYFGGHKSGKPGTYVGIELDEPRGRMQGAVAGHVYFACRPKHGVMLLSRKVELVTNAPRFDPGDLVAVGTLGEGIVRYYGSHATKAWFLRVGVELVEKLGKHDGEVDGHRYFKAKDGHGVLVKPEKLTMIVAGWEKMTGWEKKMAQREIKKREEEARKEKLKAAKEEEKRLKQEAKERLKSRYKEPSRGLTQLTDDMQEEKRRNSSEGADGPRSAPVADIRHDDAHPDEYDIQKQYDSSQEHLGTIRRKVGSRTYLFNQLKEEQDELVEVEKDPSLCGTYLEVAILTFYNKASADRYVEVLKGIVDDDREPEGFFDVYYLDVDAHNNSFVGDVSLLLFGVGTYEQYIEMHNIYDLLEASKGEDHEDRKIAKQMENQNGMKELSSNLFVVKPHSRLSSIAKKWSEQEDYDVKVIPTPQLSIIGGWRTVSNLVTKNPSFLGVVSELEFPSDTAANKFKKLSDKLSKDATSKESGLDTERVKGEIEPVNVTYSSNTVHVEKCGLFDGNTWADKSVANHDSAKWSNVFLFGPGAKLAGVTAKMDTLNKDENTTCSVLQSAL